MFGSFRGKIEQLKINFENTKPLRLLLIQTVKIICLSDLFYVLYFLGDAAVGKSSSVERFVKNEFFEFQQPTIGYPPPSTSTSPCAYTSYCSFYIFIYVLLLFVSAAFLTQTVTLDDFIVKFEIW